MATISDVAKLAGISVKQGKRGIAYCTGTKTLTLQPDGANIDSDRYTGYVDALSDKGILLGKRNRSVSENKFSRNGMKK